MKVPIKDFPSVGVLRTEQTLQDIKIMYGDARITLQAAEREVPLPNSCSEALSNAHQLIRPGLGANNLVSSKNTLHTTHRTHRTLLTSNWMCACANGLKHVIMAPHTWAHSLSQPSEISDAFCAFA